MSIRCDKCGLFNSFTFNTNQKKCIKCSAKLDINEIDASKIYRDNLKNKRYSFNNSWNSIEDNFIITNTDINNDK